MPSWLTAGTGLLGRVVPRKMTETAFAPTQGITPFGADSSFGGADVQKTGLLGMSGYGDIQKSGLLTDPSAGLWSPQKGDYGLKLDAITRTTQIAQAQQQTQQQAGSSLGGDWSNVERWNDAITRGRAQVKAELGVDVPDWVVKAIMRIESNGVMLSANADDAVGLMQLTPGSWGSYDRNRLSTDAAYNVYAGIKDLAYRYLDSPGKTWDQAAVGFFSGHYIPTGAGDDFNSDYNYLKMFQDFGNQLQASGGASYGGTPAGGGSFSAVWGGKGDFGVSQEFGMTDFARVNPSIYNYSRDYSPGGGVLGHTGVDVSMNVGTALYTPVAGTVVCQGSAGGPGDGSSGCGNFESGVCNGPCGRFELRLDNGDMLVLGHMSNISVTPGARLAAGAFVGYSGTENGGHVHVEYRRLTPGATMSGYTIVDPRSVLNGAPITGGASGSGYGGTASGATPGFDPVAWMRTVMAGG